MKHLIIALSLLTLGFNSYAEEELWAKEIQQYEKDLADRGTLNLLGGLGSNVTKAAASCSGSALTTVVTYILDTVPVTGALAEVIANIADSDGGYETIDMENLLSLKTFLDTGRGTLGGGVVMTGETLEWALLWLLGDEDIEGVTYQATRKLYESSNLVEAELFAEDSACVGSITKIKLVAGEINRRMKAALGLSEEAENTEEQLPLTLPLLD